MSLKHSCFLRAVIERFLLFVLFCRENQMLVSDSLDVVVFWFRHPCTWSASDVAAVQVSNEVEVLARFSDL